MLSKPQNYFSWYFLHPDPQASLLNLTGIHLFRGGKRVLKNVSWQVRPGEHWAIIGPNGSGKSTLFSLLQGLLWPQKGSVSVLQRNFGAEDITDIRKIIGWVGGEIEARFSPRETAREIVQSGSVGTQGLLFDKPPGSEIQRADRLIKELGIESLARKKFASLSQGEKRIITIARALMTRPALLLLDEACAGLDPVARESFLLRLAGLGKFRQGPAILAATHHVEEIRPPISHVMLLSSGEIFASGPLSRVLTSEKLSQLFGRKIDLRKSRGRYQLQLL